MAKKEYTQTIKPVSRIAERIFGWLALLGLLVIIGFILYFSFVAVNDPQVVDAVESTTEQMFQNEGANSIEGMTPEQFTDTMLMFMNQSWVIALYLVLPVILGLFGLLTMRRRILSGVLLLFSGVLSAPLVLFVVTGIIPLFFIIAAILLFVRKDTVVNEENLDAKDVKKMRKENDKLEKDRMNEEERAKKAAEDLEHDDTRRYTRNDSEWDSDLNKDDSNDIEDTRKFTKINDDEIEDYETSRSQIDEDSERLSNDDATSERRTNVNRRNNDN